MRYFVGLILLLLASGCESPTTATRSKQGKSKENAPPKIVPQFASMTAALTALTEAYQQNRAEEARGIESWFKERKDTVVAELAQLVRNDTAQFDQRVIGCRTLARMGSESVPALLELTNHPTDQLRYRAAESLAMISPSDPRVVNALRELFQRDDHRLRSYAIRGFGNAGGLAKAMVPELEEILNDRNQNDGLRNDAKTALKKIDPRQGLMGLNGSTAD